MWNGWALLAVLACVWKHADAAAPLGDWRQGIATFYGGAPDRMVRFGPKRVG